MEDDLEGNTSRVLHFIQENPGCHLRKIKRELELSMGTIQYHLIKLEKLGRISSSRHVLYKYYFPVGIFEERQKDSLIILSHETTREILMFIIEQKNPTHTDIVNEIGISSASVNWHIRRLLDFSLIEEIKEGKYKRYSLQGDPKYFLAIMKNYYPNIWDKWSSRLVEMFLSVNAEEEN